MSDNSVTQHVAKAVCGLRYDDLPAAVIDKSRVLIADTLIAAAAGRAEPSGIAMSAVTGSSSGLSRIWFGDIGESRPPVDATFINTLNAGALDFDSLNAAVHADLVCLPAAWAMAEHCQRQPREMVAAHMIASEVVSRLSRGSTKPSKGWSGTSIYGGMGAAIASGLMLGLDEVQMTHALGLAAAQAAGSQQANLENTLAKRLQPALAARDGVFAALLAQAGATAPVFALEGKFGMRNLYQDGDDSLILEGWGQDWQVLETLIKRYPICACSHAAVHALWELQVADGFKSTDVVKLTATISPFMHRLVGGEFEPSGDLQVIAQFNLRYQLASTLVRGPMSLPHLSPEAVLDPVIGNCLPVIHLQVDLDNIHELSPASVTVQLKDGRLLNHACNDLPGSPTAPLTHEQWQAKALECAAAGGASDEAFSGVLSRLERLTELPRLDCVWSEND
ncbi:MmgE/PrpD family protein [Pseudomonas sp. 21LCFQ02]|uniref:MmgE/PrpD family protein n=1 Tax=Pseudomonas sp. 21LCFQ02 TaxID=2957505 RepID=UPI00209A71F3|nr:MmgE/PrpD family protein [Pseudomonas sp. 21LCFQ02]MCO8167511.1 MmgE/PrpD family protein [Pseudomonas sp. 21LCFQ02]